MLHSIFGWNTAGGLDVSLKVKQAVYFHCSFWSLTWKKKQKKHWCSLCCVPDFSISPSQSCFRITCHRAQNVFNPSEQLYFEDNNRSDCCSYVITQETNWTSHHSFWAATATSWYCTEFVLIWTPWISDFVSLSNTCPNARSFVIQQL